MQNDAGARQPYKPGKPDIILNKAQIEALEGGEAVSCLHFVGDMSVFMLPLLSK